MIVFGDTNLGYLSLLLVYPLIIWRVFRRFLPTDWAFVLLTLFVATPIGAYFGSTFFLYVKYALQGFGDPVSYLFYLAGLALIVGWPPEGPGNRFGAACAGAALLFLATFVRPIVAPAVAVLLGGAGLAALWQRQWSRLAGLCAGFAPVLAMPLHNWYFGDRLVLFSANASGNNLHVTPADYVAALVEMSHLNFAGPHVHAVAIQLIDWPTGFIGQRDLGGLAAYAASAPVHLAAIAILVYVAGWGRRYDPWLRLIAGAALAQHTVAFFYGGASRYFFLTWLLTMLVAAVWCERDGIALFRRFAPNVAERIARSRLAAGLGAALTSIEGWLQLGGTGLRA